VYKRVENVDCTAVLCINVWKIYSALLFCVYACEKCTVYCCFVYNRVENVQCTAVLCRSATNTE